MVVKGIAAMNAPAARIGFYVLLSLIAVAAVAGGLTMSRRIGEIADAEHAAWGASAG